MNSRVKLLIVMVVVALATIAAQGKYREARFLEEYAVTTAIGATETAWVRDTTASFDIAGWETWQFQFTVIGDTSTPKGIGVKDSITVYLATLTDSATWTRVDSAAGHIPFTWKEKYKADSVATAHGSKCRYEFWIFDTLADTTATINYDATVWHLES